MSQPLLKAVDTETPEPRVSKPAPVEAPSSTTPPAAGDAGTKSKKKDKPKRRRRHILLRLFGISPWGWLKLAVLCVIVGSFVMAVNFDPRTAEVDLMSAASQFVSDAWTAAGWLVRNFWQPALAGATVVLPLWVLWRLVSLPFRR